MSKSGDTSADAKRSRLIHVRLDTETHRRLRVVTAERDATIQDWVATLIERELNHLQASKDRKGRR